MYQQIHLLCFAMLFSFLAACRLPTKSNETVSQTSDTNKLVGGGCDGCELMYVGMPTNIKAVDTSAGWREEGQKLLIKGTVFEKDGKTPAPHVVIYYWQTDHNGFYSPKPGMEENAKRHGHIRGWVKTDIQGNYSIFTIRPAPYPNENIPAHIHVSIKEPNIDNEYYIDEFVFDDDKLLTSEKRNALENRGGCGILYVLTKDKIQIAEHNILLGFNIPNYPVIHKEPDSSRLHNGEE